MLPHLWEIDQNFCSLVKSPPLARTPPPPPHGVCIDRCISLCTLIRCLETVSNSFEDYIMLPEVKQLHSSVRNYSTAPIKLTKKLGIRSRYEMFVYTSNKNLLERHRSRRERTVQYGAQFSATKNVNLYFLPWNSRNDLKFQRQLASAFSLHM